MRPLPSLRDLGAAMAALRHERGMSQAELARVTGVARPYLAGVERGARNPTWKTLLRIVAGLDATMGEVVRRAEAGEPEDPPP